MRSRRINVRVPGPAIAGVALALGLAVAVAAPPEAAAGRGVIYDGSAWLGVEVAELTPKGAEAAGLPAERHAVVVTKVFPGSPAETAGIVAGDVILQVGDEKITGVSKLIGHVSTLPVDSDVLVKLRRGGKPVNAHVRLGLRPGEPFRIGTSRGGDPFGRDADTFDVFDLDLYFPPGWDSGLDPEIAEELRRLVDEMRAMLKGTRATIKWHGAGLKDPFGRHKAPADVKDPFSETGDDEEVAAPGAGADGEVAEPEPEVEIEPWSPEPAPAAGAAGAGSGAGAGAGTGKAKAKAKKPAAKAKPAKPPKTMPEIEVEPSPAPRRGRPGT